MRREYSADDDPARPGARTWHRRAERAITRETLRETLRARMQNRAATGVVLALGVNPRAPNGRWTQATDARTVSSPVPTPCAESR